MSSSHLHVTRERVARSVGRGFGWWGISEIKGRIRAEKGGGLRDDGGHGLPSPFNSGVLGGE